MGCEPSEWLKRPTMLQRQGFCLVSTQLPHPACRSANNRRNIEQTHSADCICSLAAHAIRLTTNEEERHKTTYLPASQRSILAAKA